MIYFEGDVSEQGEHLHLFSSCLQLVLNVQAKRELLINPINIFWPGTHFLLPVEYDVVQSVVQSTSFQVNQTIPGLSGYKVSNPWVIVINTS